MHTTSADAVCGSSLEHHRQPGQAGRAVWLSLDILCCAASHHWCVGVGEERGHEHGCEHVS
eukprot:1161076-Pelagomonas_calceolata.AAC.10